ncbi:hypothetical protein [uncultured Cetobacterium sp.]|uniref:hypothetical protein n=1 Tax=uncultured Cetobacterium sp. TaxID=527638 RepID=UPI00260FA26D|nr:hypothetical protein [uncultured Cetobacterium sp.]
MKNKIAMIVIFTLVMFVNLYAKGGKGTIFNNIKMKLKNPAISKTSEIITYTNGNFSDIKNDEIDSNFISQQNVKFIIDKMN